MLRGLLLATCSGAVIAGLVSVSSASADGLRYGATATANNVEYLSDSCYNSEVTYAGLNPASDSQIYAYGPDGQVADSDFTFDAATYRGTLQVCPWSDPPGVYTIKVNNAYAGSFTVTQPHFEVWRYSKRVLKAELDIGSDYVLPGRRVTVEYGYRGSWLTAFHATTNGNGRAQAVCKRHHRCAVYVRFNYDGFVYSRSVKLYMGPVNGRVAVLTPRREAAH